MTTFVLIIVTSIKAILVIIPIINIPTVVATTNISIVTLKPKISAFATNNPTLLLKHIPYIYSSLRFQKDKEREVEALIDFGSKANMITPAYTKKLGL